VEKMKTWATDGGSLSPVPQTGATGRQKLVMKAVRLEKGEQKKARTMFDLRRWPPLQKIEKARFKCLFPAVKNT
jgi:hypothetical protein